MLQTLILDNFKAFKQLNLPLRPLTLLTGMNGMGKSTVIQSLLLLRQSYLGRLEGDRGKTPRLVLNGDLIQLGAARDIHYRSAERDEIGFTIDFSDEGRMVWRYDYVPASNALTPQEARDITFDLAQTSLFNDQFHYLQAERLGPRATYAYDDYQVRERKNFGTRGEYIPHFLDQWNGLRNNNTWEVEKNLHHKDAVGTSLIHEVEAWMGEISPGVRFNLTPLPDTDLIQMQVGFGDGEFFRATNVGFGISYTLPIVVAMLASQPGELILLENPEAHLHPRGQFEMGKLLARAASSGVQVLVETHSDHVVNGIRVAIRGDEDDEDEFRLEDGKVAFHFFQRDADKKPFVVSPTLDEDGRFVSQTPVYFFDEFRRSMRKLL